MRLPDHTAVVAVEEMIAVEIVAQGAIAVAQGVMVHPATVVPDLK